MSRIHITVLREVEEKPRKVLGEVNPCAEGVGEANGI
jgi:hypothetical protein